MRTVSIFTDGKSQFIRIPKDIEFTNVSELEIVREGNTLILRPARPDWLSFTSVEKAGDDFLLKRSDVVVDENRLECLSTPPISNQKSIVDMIAMPEADLELEAPRLSSKLFDAADLS